uniref:RanBD1 domain-containing protein n=1 Tax=Steinernema glaseri TaxID=37863 RepID=A0A1I7ZXA8_9BILA
MDSPLRDNVKVRRFSTMTFAPRGVSTPLTAAIKEEPDTAPLPKENAPIVPSFVTTIQQPPVSQPFKQKLNFSTPAAPATPVSVTPVVTKESALFKELISLDDDEKPKAEPVKKEVPVPETTPVVLPPAPVTPKATTTAVPVHDTPKGPTFSTLFGGPAKPVEASTSTAPSVAPAPANPIVTTPTAAPAAVPTTAPASSEAAAPPASTASPSTFSFKPKEPSTGTTASSFSFKPKEPSTGTTPSVFGGFGSSTKPSSLFGGSAIKPAATETAPAAPTSPSAFSFSKPAENKTSLFGKPVATTPASGAVASNNDEGMMEDDAPEATSSAKTGSLFASSGFLSGMGSAVPKGEVKNQAAQSPSSFSFKPTTNTAGASSFGKATFGGGSSPFSGGSTFGGGASFGAKPAFGGSTTPATGGGFSSFASAGGSGFAKFAQQGNSGFGAAATGASTFGGSTMTPTQASTFGGGTSSSFSNQGASFKGWR